VEDAADCRESLQEKYIMLAAMNRVILFVGDVERCANFYRDLFDLSPIESRRPSDEWCELDAGGCRLAFHKAYGPDGPVDGPTGGPNNPHKIVFYAEDVPAMREELIRRGAQMEDASIAGDLALCDGSDPEGHRFQISNRL
jgi:predicted enzyme related to lactoylglutathione lyase